MEVKEFVLFKDNLLERMAAMLQQHVYAGVQHDALGDNDGMYGDVLDGDAPEESPVGTEDEMEQHHVGLDYGSSPSARPRSNNVVEVRQTFNCGEGRLVVELDEGAPLLAFRLTDIVSGCAFGASFTAKAIRDLSGVVGNKKDCRTMFLMLQEALVGHQGTDGQGDTSQKISVEVVKYDVIDKVLSGAGGVADADDALAMAAKAREIEERNTQERYILLRYVTKFDSAVFHFKLVRVDSRASLCRIIECLREKLMNERHKIDSMQRRMEQMEHGVGNEKDVWATRVATAERQAESATQRAERAEKRADEIAAEGKRELEAARETQEQLVDKLESTGHALKSALLRAVHAEGQLEGRIRSDVQRRKKAKGRVASAATARREMGHPRVMNGAQGDEVSDEDESYYQEKRGGYRSRGEAPRSPSGARSRGTSAGRAGSASARRSNSRRAMGSDNGAPTGGMRTRSTSRDARVRSGAARSRSASRARSSSVGAFDVAAYEKQRAAKRERIMQKAHERCERMISTPSSRFHSSGASKKNVSRLVSTKRKGSNPRSRSASARRRVSIREADSSSERGTSRGRSASSRSGSTSGNTARRRMRERGSDKEDQYGGCRSDSSTASNHSTGSLGSRRRSTRSTSSTQWDKRRASTNGGSRYYSKAAKTRVEQRARSLSPRRNYARPWLAGTRHPDAYKFAGSGSGKVRARGSRQRAQGAKGSRSGNAAPAAPATEEDPDDWEWYGPDFVNGFSMLSDEEAPNGTGAGFYGRPTKSEGPPARHGRSITGVASPQSFGGSSYGGSHVDDEEVEKYNRSIDTSQGSRNSSRGHISFKQGSKEHDGATPAAHDNVLSISDEDGYNPYHQEDGQPTVDELHHKVQVALEAVERTPLAQVSQVRDDNRAKGGSRGKVRKARKVQAFEGAGYQGVANAAHQVQRAVITAVASSSPYDARGMGPGTPTTPGESETKIVHMSPCLDAAIEEPIGGSEQQEQPKSMEDIRDSLQSVGKFLHEQGLMDSTN